jgi:dihydrofolate synthase/folylpolyglutamate synthase
LSSAPRPRTLAEWLTLQESVHARSIDLGLARVAEVARRLGVEHPPYRVITVGGTNGKGSTVAFLEALLEAGGQFTGALSSPHLTRYNERIHLGGREATDAELIGAFERIEAARGEITLTFFEYNTLAGLVLFAAAQVDVAVLEVGLGGRLDATNVVDAHVAVLCSVGFDHRDWLGDTLQAIGREKAGIFRAGRPVVLGSPDMPASVFAAIADLEAPALIAERDFSWEVSPQGWTYRTAARTLERLPPPPLTGAIQYRNASTALTALGALTGVPQVTTEQVARAFGALHLLGRFQVIAGPVEWILDVAHNEPAAEVLASNLAARAPRRSLAVCGILRDKDAAAIGEALKGSIDEWILCTLPGPRGCTAAELAARLGTDVHPAALADSVAAGCEHARAAARAGDRVVVFGSFATVGSALEWLRLYLPSGSA